MFDQAPDFHWDGGPSPEEIAALVNKLKRVIIKTYHLQTTRDGGLTVEIPKPSNECTDEEKVLHCFYSAARLELMRVVALVKGVFPQKYWYIFDELTEVWMPEIE